MNFMPYEEKILNKLILPNMQAIQILRLKYGLYLVFDGIKKGILVYGTAFILGVFIETLLVHISFLVIRQVSFGWHSANSMGCILWSIFTFPILTYFFRQIYFNSFLLFLISSICCLIVWLIGPVGTQVNTLSNVKHKQLLHRKLKRRILAILFLILILHPIISKYVMLGIGIQIATLLIQCIKNGVVIDD